MAHYVIRTYELWIATYDVHNLLFVRGFVCFPGQGFCDIPYSLVNDGNLTMAYNGLLQEISIEVGSIKLLLLTIHMLNDQPKLVDQVPSGMAG